MVMGGVHLLRYRDLSERGIDGGAPVIHKGELTPEELRLNRRALPLLAVASYTLENDVLRLEVSTFGPPLVLSLEVQGDGARTIQSSIDHAVRLWEEANPGKNRGERFRVRPCPSCDRFVDLTGFPPSPQVYCRECDTVFSLKDRTRREELEFRTCPLCGYYSRVSPFRAFFLVVACIPGIGSMWATSADGPGVRCHPCMRGDAWKMVFVNLIGCVAVPFGMYQLIRAYFFGSSRSRWFAELDKANRGARAGRPEDAEREYRTILKRVDVAAGVRANQARARLAAGDGARALEEAQRALQDCSTYDLAHDLEIRALEALGRAEDAARAAREWPRPHGVSE